MFIGCIKSDVINVFSASDMKISFYLDLFIYVHMYLFSLHQHLFSVLHLPLPEISCKKVTFGHVPICSGKCCGSFALHPPYVTIMTSNAVSLHLLFHICQLSLGSLDINV